MQQIPVEADLSSHPGSLTARARHWLRTVAGLDRAILFSILARVWSSTAGVVTVALIARFLSPAEQGYYYTFGSLVALQIVFELGFSFVILQMASHERAHLAISPEQHVTGDPVAHGRLASVIQMSVRWYSVAAVLMVCALVPAGLHFFSVHQPAGAPVAWRAPWCLVAGMAMLTFQLDPILSFLEGCGFVANIARLRFVQAATGSLLAWAALLTHHGLFAPAMMIAGTASVSLVWIAGKRRLLLGLLRYRPGSHRIRWGYEVWPFQWRIAVSWLCGYFIFQLFNPVLFAFKGPVAAGQMGMSLSLASALQAVAISWLSTKSAPFGGMIARKEYQRLDQVFFAAMKQSVTVCAAGALILWLGCVYLNVEHFRFAHRLLSPPALGILLLATTLNIIGFGQALYLRAHKQEKFLLNSIVCAILIGTSTYFFGKHYGAIGMVTGYLLVGLLVGLAMGTYTFVKWRRIWHV